MDHDFFFDRPNETRDRGQIEAHQRSALGRMFAEVFSHNSNSRL